MIGNTFCSPSEDDVINKMSIDYEGINEEFRKPISKIDIELNFLPEDSCFGGFVYSELFEEPYYADVFKSISNLLYKSYRNVCVFTGGTDNSISEISIGFYDDCGFKDVYVIGKEINCNDLNFIAEKFYSIYLIYKKN